ncbi:MAG: hypothetical protein ACRCWR_10395 [Saezia sp.]
MANKKEQISTSLHLLPLLEYCSPERAASLLNCEVEDIFHFASTGAITLYVEFFKHETKREASEIISVGKLDFGLGLLSTKINRITDDVGAYEGRKYIEVTDTSEAVDDTFAIIYHSCFYYDAELVLLNPSDGLLNREVHLSGLWAMTTSSVKQIQGFSKAGFETPIDLYAQVSNSEQYKFKFGADLYDVVVPNLNKRLRIVYADLLKIQDAMESGKPIERQANPYKEKSFRSEFVPKEAASSNERITSKQCSYIVTLLRSMGLSDEDFSGSIGKLRAKLNNMKVEPDVDDNTLTSWLKKAGARHSDN